MHARQEHQVARTPRIKIAVREHSRHAEILHLGHVVPAQHRPLIRQHRINPRVIRSIAHRIVIEERHRLVQVMQHLRMEIDIRVQNIVGQVQRHRHGVAIVIVRYVMSPIQQPRPLLTRMRLVPLVNVHHAVAPIHLDHRRNQHHHVLPYVLDVRRIIHCQPIRQLHQRSRRTRLRRVDRARDVVHRERLRHQRLRLRIVHADRARIRQLRQSRIIFFHLLDERNIADRRRNHLAAFFRLADTEHLHPRRTRSQQAKVLVDILGIRQHVRRPSNIAQHLRGRRHRRRSRQIIRKTRVEVRLGRIFLDRRRIRLVNRLLRIACKLLLHCLRRLGLRINCHDKQQQRETYS